MRYNPDLHHRRSIRLPAYDYAAFGYYFVTICTHEREMIFADPAISETVQSTWDSLAKRFATIELDEFVVMPNHVHGVVLLQARPGPAPTLGKVIRAFKSISAIAVNRFLDRHERSVWQRNYYERIIRLDRELESVREYIRNNPLGWDVDPENPNAVMLSQRG